MPSSFKLSLIAAAALCTGLAHAHGGADHGAERAAAASRPEQMPWGIAGSGQAVQRTIAVKMTDAMRFEPARIDVKEGETVKFVVTNAGKLMHEMVIGTRKSLDEHAALMSKFPEMEHEEPYGVHVPPGKTGEIVWHFNRAGRFDFACLVAGHYQAGMTGTLNVAAGAAAVPAPAAAAPAPAPAPAKELTRGEVRKIDREAKKITLRHEALKSLDMPAMTMVFRVADPALLDKVQVGDTISFKAERVDGAITVTAIEAAP